MPSVCAHCRAARMLPDGPPRAMVASRHSARDPTATATARRPRVGACARRRCREPLRSHGSVRVRLAPRGAWPAASGAGRRAPGAGPFERASPASSISRASLAQGHQRALALRAIKATAPARPLRLALAAHTRPPCTRTQALRLAVDACVLASPGPATSTRPLAAGNTRGLPVLVLARPPSIQASLARQHYSTRTAPSTAYRGHCSTPPPPESPNAPRHCCPAPLRPVARQSHAPLPGATGPSALRHRLA